MRCVEKLILLFLLIAPLVASAEEITQSSVVKVRVFRPEKLELLTPGVIMSNVIDGINRPQGPVPRETVVSLLFADALKSAVAKKMEVSDIPEDVEEQKRKRPLSPSEPNTLEIFADYQSIQYLPLKWSTYQYGLKVRARMIGADGRVSWEQKCYIKPFNEDLRFQLTKDQFDGDGVAIGKVIRSAAEFCADEVSKKIQH
ncbi:hypothetical protein J2X02_002125 [Pseudoxanthomonas japonensis]|uniref:hypothetical protein n=1 Tax=Pseudoxanthomonas TaxID=83618 RepID=UPI0007838F64|nr:MULTISPECIES: hypothetical protein [Pseudoxanthomonas]MDR7069274.1 hypothetical protein [Pseudoxanthomonas japonensis]